jgi:lipoprotein-releasing system permease protein
MATVRRHGATADDPNKDFNIIEPGDEITLVMPSCTEVEAYDGPQTRLKPVLANLVVTDVAKSGMSEFDANIVYLHIKDMQRLRTMNNRATAILIKLKDYDRDAKEVVETLRAHFHPSLYVVQSWEERKAPILSAIAIERGLLNVLLFLIIAVAGFGILAIFFMIVVEKMRDIGVLKALGASNGGVMGVFLGYGLALGVVGAGLGTILGIIITVKINWIEHKLTQLTGQEIFPRDVYYFDKIPTDLQPMMVVYVILGALAIAVGASVLPALRAAVLRPVQALRYE